MDLSPWDYREAGGRGRKGQTATTEPPHWYYPVRQSLGATQLLRGDLSGAEDTFRQSLVRVRNNGWALFGLREVYVQAGRPDAAAAVAKRLDQVWAGDREILDLMRL